MFHFLPAAGLACLTLLAAPGAFAQTAPPPYRCVLEDYQPFNEQKVLPWKESNDTVGRVGGWRAYAKEAQDGDGDKPAGTAVPDPHAGHGEQSK